MFSNIFIDELFSGVAFRVQCTVCTGAWLTVWSPHDAVTESSEANICIFRDGISIACCSYVLPIFVQQAGLDITSPCFSSTTWTDWMQPSVICHDNRRFYVEDLIFVIASNGWHLTFNMIHLNSIELLIQIGFCGTHCTDKCEKRNNSHIKKIEGNIKSSLINEYASWNQHKHKFQCAEIACTILLLSSIHTIIYFYDTSLLWFQQTYLLCQLYVLHHTCCNREPFRFFYVIFNVYIFKIFEW